MCFTWIEDVADILAQCTFDYRTKNETFNIGNTIPITMKELANLINFFAFGENRELNFVSATDYEYDVKVRIPSITKLKNIISTPKFMPIESIIQQCLGATK
jgi:nucleoside-diphosphate-sugar epimerase